MNETAVTTVSDVDPLTDPNVAVIVVVPGEVLLAKPDALIAATAGDEEVQATDELKFCVLLSVYVPIAVNCCEAPAEMEGFDGVTLMDTSDGAATVSVVPPVTLPKVA